MDAFVRRSIGGATKPSLFELANVLPIGLRARLAAGSPSLSPLPSTAPIKSPGVHTSERACALRVLSILFEDAKL